MGPFREVNNLMSFFDPNLPNPAVGGRPGALNFAGSGTNHCNCSTPVSTHYKNFGPRLGAAYRINDKTVLRAGFSVMYVHLGGVGGRNNSRQGLSQLGFNATNNATSPGNPLIRLRGAWRDLGSPSHRRHAGHGVRGLSGSS